MSESTLEAPPVPDAAIPDTPPAAEPWTLRRFVREHPWWTIAVALVIVSFALLVYAKTRPSYDAYGWLVWGYQTLHLSLDLGGAPSWKPLPYLFTVPFALAGHYELWLWMITCVAISLAGSIFAGRIAYRLIGGEDPERRNAALAGAVFAGAAVLGLQDYMHYILSVQSDPMIVTFTLAMLDMFLIGRYRWALAFGVLASLGRPEAWVFFGLYSLWLWRSRPAMRWMLYAGWAVILFMWFGVPTITNHRPFISGQLAQNSPRELKQNKITGTIDRFTGLQYLPIWLASLVTIAVAVWRRHRLVLALTVGIVLWVVVEIAFALHGWPALPRYVMEPAAVAGVFAGVAVGWLLLDLPRWRRGIPQWAGIPIVIVLVGSLVPGALSRVRTERTDIHHERGRAHEIALLQSTVDAVGGPTHVTNCGKPTSYVEYVSALAWFVHWNVGPVGHLVGYEMHRKYPIVVFTPLVHGGWDVLPWHTLATKVARCRGLHATYLATPSHPGGYLIRR